MSELRALLVAIREGELERVRQQLRTTPGLLAARTPEGSSLVLAALWANQPEVAEALCAAGAEVDFATAVALGELAAVSEGLDYEPTLVDAESGDGFPALVLAACFGRVAILERLLAAGAAVDRPARAGLMPRALHAAVVYRDPAVRRELVDRLLAAGAAVDATQLGGYTPLMLAAGRGDQVTVERLVAAGAQLGLTSDGGDDAASLARRRGQLTLAEWLERRLTPLPGAPRASPD